MTWPVLQGKKCVPTARHKRSTNPWRSLLTTCTHLTKIHLGFGPKQHRAPQRPTTRVYLNGLMILGI
jgi:hypothetical protein